MSDFTITLGVAELNDLWMYGKFQVNGQPYEPTHFEQRLGLMTKEFAEEVTFRWSMKGNRGSYYVGLVHRPSGKVHRARFEGRTAAEALEIFRRANDDYCRPFDFALLEDRGELLMATGANA